MGREGGGGGRHIRPCHSRVTIPCDLRPFLHFSPNSGRSLAGGISTSVWNLVCCIWNGQVETDVLRRFNRTAMLTHDPFEICFGQSSTAVRSTRFVYQRERQRQRDRDRERERETERERDRSKPPRRIPIECLSYHQLHTSC